MKKIKILTITLAIILVTIVAFFGVYTHVQNRMENKVETYSYSMDLKGGRNIKISVDNSSKTVVKDSEGKEVSDADELSDKDIEEKGYKKEEVKYNSDDVLNSENYNKTKKVIENRLKELEIQEYNIRVNEETGDIFIEIPENDMSDSVVSRLSAQGKFEIVDSDTKEILMDNNDLKLVNVLYGSNNSTTTSSGTTVYLNIEFNDEGIKKLEDISNKYTGNSDTTTDEEKAEDVKKEVTLLIDDSELLTTHFDEPIKTGKLQLSIGSASKDTETIKDYMSQASNIAVVLNNGKMPVKYVLNENEYKLSDITSEDLNIVLYIGIGVSCAALLFLIIKYKIHGLLGAISYIGLASILLLVIRYTNVDLSIQGILGIILSLMLEYMFIYKIILKTNSKEYKKSTTGEILKDVYKEMFIRILPICIAVIVFCFAGWAPISSFGMVMFWGIVLISAYNSTVTNLLFRVEDEK